VTYIGFLGYLKYFHHQRSFGSVFLRMTFALAAIALAISNMANANALADDLIGQASVIVLSHFPQNRVVLLVW
jgi:hypothetical protein